MKTEQMQDQDVFDKVIYFLDEIGIAVNYQELLEADCFLPGFLIKDGTIVIDKNKVLFPGDILHEAAHIAVVPGIERSNLQGKTIGSRSEAAAEEMMAIAWSYAACIHLKIDPHIVFHPSGYKGGGAGIVASFDKGEYFGVPVLAWLGMTNTPSVCAAGNTSYPIMTKWLRD